MESLYMNKLIFLILVIAGILSSCSKSNKEDKTAETPKEQTKQTESKAQSYYTCSMHPEVHEDKPGKCPICHMNLVKVEVEEDSSSDQMKSSSTGNTENASDIIAKVKLRKAQLSHFKPDYFPVSKMKMSKKIRLLGSVLQSEEKESSIPARINGRVEKVYVKSTGSFVKIGDTVVDIYSPQLITAGEEYLLARESFNKSKSREFKEMLTQSEERLLLWGIKEFQFEKWFKEKNVPKQITIHSAATGIVRKRHATVGKYFKEGQNFFELSDLSEIWVEMDVYEHDAALIELGQNVELKFSSLPGEILEGEVDFINPVLEEKSRTLKIRTTILNTRGTLKPGMVADATLSLDLPGEPLVVPRSAVIDTGKRKVVWLKVDDQSFQAKIIHTGQESEGYVEIKHGLKEGDYVVIEGNFLLDAQAQLFGGYEDMNTQKSSGHQH